MWTFLDGTQAMVPSQLNHLALRPDHHDTIAFTFLREEYNGGDIVVVGVYVMEDATHSLVTVAHHKQPNGKHTPANTQQPMSPG